MNRLTLVLFTLALGLGLLASMPAGPQVDGPLYVCVDPGHESIDCYLYGDAPSGSPIVYTGPRSGIPGK